MMEDKPLLEITCSCGSKLVYRGKDEVHAKELAKQFNDVHKACPYSTGNIVSRFFDRG